MTDPVTFWPADFAGWAVAARNYGLDVGGMGAFANAVSALTLNRRRTNNDSDRLRNEDVRLQNEAARLENDRGRLVNEEARLETDRNRLVNDTYVKAIEQLGHKSMEVRLGAIYALERIAATDRDYHWPIMETLCAYIRERPASKWDNEPTAETLTDGKLPRNEAPLEDQHPGEEAESINSRPEPKRPPTDIRAILTVFERRSDGRKAWEETEGLRLDLRHADLRGAELTFVELQRADLRGADLRGANLRGAFLWNANLGNANLFIANLGNAYLSDAKFSRHPSELGARWDEGNPPRLLDSIKIVDR